MPHDTNHCLICHCLTCHCLVICHRLLSHPRTTLLPNDINHCLICHCGISTVLLPLTLSSISALWIRLACLVTLALLSCLFTLRRCPLSLVMHHLFLPVPPSKHMVSPTTTVVSLLGTTFLPCMRCVLPFVISLPSLPSFAFLILTFLVLLYFSFLSFFPILSLPYLEPHPTTVLSSSSCLITGAALLLSVCQSLLRSLSI